MRAKPLDDHGVGESGSPLNIIVIIMEICSTGYRRGLHLYFIQIFAYANKPVNPNNVPYTGHWEILSFPCTYRPVWEPFFIRRWFVIFTLSRYIHIETNGLVDYIIIYPWYLKRKISTVFFLVEIRQEIRP